MADIVFNIAKGRVNELHDRVAGNDPAASTIVIVLLKAAESDAVLQDYDTLADLLNAAGNTEADFTNYARKELTDAGISASVVDDTNNRREADLPDQTWTSAGGASNNSLVKLLVCYDPNGSGTGTDSTVVPLVALDFVATTDGNNLIAQFNASGYFRAA